MLLWVQAMEGEPARDDPYVSSRPARRVFATKARCEMSDYGPVLMGFLTHQADLPLRFRMGYLADFSALQEGQLIFTAGYVELDDCASAFDQEAQDIVVLDIPKGDYLCYDVVLSGGLDKFQAELSDLKKEIGGYDLVDPLVIVDERRFSFSVIDELPVTVGVLLKADRSDEGASR